ncbi:hypothetical protein SLEP1_g31524 [Rubroshorea leprosula]|uniref:Uncharacterized protein n=1 Tax=Rubroshorea leprosula TaxID=152421 RepID=A0AAV5KAJ6_9ROSI|nr:hypothetical protein SLEP1_g31524 [Rubroshorea leprosula]
MLENSGNEFENENKFKFNISKNSDSIQRWSSESLWTKVFIIIVIIIIILLEQSHPYYGI